MSRITRFLCLLLLCSLLMGLLPAGVLAAPLPREEEQVQASVPSISSPYTTHPTVFMVEDTYQIAFATNANGIAWVEIGGVKYEDADNGLLNWKTKYHKITVPMSVLDAAKSYTICFRSLSERPAYDPVPGSTASRTYPFSPVPEDRDPVFFCASDQHGTADYALSVSKTNAFDVYVFAGDYVSTLVSDTNVKLLLDMTGGVTQGTKPTIYSRGNHEIRGSHCEYLKDVGGYSETTGAYYTVKLPGIYAIVLDAGEDKVDSHSEYGGTVDFEAYRAEETKWLRELVESREWEQYPVRMVFTHVPFSYYAADTLETVYKNWTELLDQMGVSLVVSGHTHKYAIQGPTGSRHKTTPNYTQLIVSDKENGDVTYSGTFLTVSESKFTTKTVTNTGTTKATATIPVFTNAYNPTSAEIKTAPAQAYEGELVTSPATRASVPSISSPYTLHPTVFAVEDGYQIIFTTDATGMAWVEVGGKKYKDSETGLMNWSSKYHSVRVPRVALDGAREYKVCFQSMSNRAAYSPTHGSTVSRTYPFTPMADKKEPVILCLSDFRGLATEAKAVAAYGSYDALYIGGDYAYQGNTEANVKTLLDTASAITTGTKPVIFTRGNREIRGNYSYLLDTIAPTSSTGKSYFTIEQSNFFAIVLDSGEDKADSDSAYGNTNNYEDLRAEQTQWLLQVLEEGKWKDYPTRVAFCHIPITTISTAAMKETYNQWTQILNQMGITLMFSGHKYSQKLYTTTDSAHVSGPNFPTLVVCDVDNADYKYSGSYVTLGSKTVTIKNVSAAKKLLSTTTTANVTAESYKKNGADTYLLFDFLGDEPALERYHSSAYGGINFDQKGNWDVETNTSAITMSRGVLSFSPGNDTATSFGIYSRVPGGAKGQWAYRPLNYITKSTDYVQIRFKIDNAVSSASDGTAKFRLDVDCPNDLDDSADTSKTWTRFEKSFKVADVVDKGYVTVSMSLNSTEYNKFEYMNLVHPQFVNLKSASGATAVISIDYIYIGPMETAPQSDSYLFVDFTDTEADRERYDSQTYNHMNLDKAAYWTPYNGSPVISVQDGALKLAVMSGNTDTSYSARSRQDDISSMHYIPGQNDVLKVRIKINNAVSTNADGTATFRMNMDRPNTIVNSAGSSRTWCNIPINFNLNDHVNQGWFELETQLTDAEYLASDWINLLHPQFLNMQSASGKTAEFYIDYIYVGPATTELPVDVQVTFCTEEGTVLEQQSVAKGSGTSYQGQIPSKAYNESAHYTFSAWVDASGKVADLSKIMEDTTLYPTYTAEAHAYEESIVNLPSCSHTGLKKLSCTCGYSKTEAIPTAGHSAEVLPGTAPTCTASGLTEGSRCTVCGEILIAQEVIPAKGHTEVTDKAVAATCTANGLTEGMHCSVCNTVLTAQQVIPAKGHSYIYTPVDANTHKVTCANCDYTATVKHAYTDGSCICGEAEIKDPVLSTTLKLYHSLNLASDISVNFAIPAAYLGGFDMDTVYVETRYYDYVGNAQSEEKVIRLDPVLNGSYYYFTLEGLTAIHMTNELSSVLYGTKDGQPYYSPVDEYSIATYAYSQLTSTTAAA
ncbi:MAG: metallophosphoesterase, partial [Oscillospiraceae bacterium]|nr:metallophosphoesterase [Oscillospiraceae bacterium]